MACKYCKGNHSSSDHAHTNSMKSEVNKEAKKKADFGYKAEAHNRKAEIIRKMKTK